MSVLGGLGLGKAAKDAARDAAKTAVGEIREGIEAELVRRREQACDDVKEHRKAIELLRERRPWWWRARVRRRERLLLQAEARCARLTEECGKVGNGGDVA